MSDGNQELTTNLNNILTLIDEKKITADDFNLFLESLPKSTKERLHRQTRQDRIEPTDGSPIKKAVKSLARDGNNNPLKTARGKAAVRRQGEDNKANANKFKVAAEFINKCCCDKPIEECEGYETIDENALSKLSKRLLIDPKCPISSDWLYKIASKSNG